MAGIRTLGRRVVRRRAGWDRLRAPGSVACLVDPPVDRLAECLADVLSCLSLEPRPGDASTPPLMDVAMLAIVGSAAVTVGASPSTRASVRHAAVWSAVPSAQCPWMEPSAVWAAGLAQPVSIAPRTTQGPTRRRRARLGTRWLVVMRRIVGSGAARDHRPVVRAPAVPTPQYGPTIGAGLVVPAATRRVAHPLPVTPVPRHDRYPKVLLAVGTFVPSRLDRPDRIEAGPSSGDDALTDDWWMVLDRSNERIVYRSTSSLEAFRLARRSAGGAVRLAVAPGYGISVTGRRGTVTVLRVPRNAETRRRRVAIPIAPMDRGESVLLPDGSRFTWIPALVDEAKETTRATASRRRAAAAAGRSRPPG